MSTGYSGTPLPKKLGISPHARVLLLGDPLSFELVSLTVKVETLSGASANGCYDVVLLFCPDLETLVNLFDPAKAAHTTPGAIWVCWPKKSSRLITDLAENTVREYGLRQGRVDVKVAAVDDLWSGLKFVTRLADR
jgi:hypothetical protein